MKTIFMLIKRNVKLFFKDKGMFFTSLITPAILLVLYTTFLGNVYRESFSSNLPPMFEIPENLIDSFVVSQTISSILAVSCVTVAFCSNMLMVQDKSNGSISDIRISPVKPSYLALSYYAASLISTLIISLFAMGICLVYLATVEFYMSFSEVVLLFLDVIMLVMFGTALSSVINFFLSTQGQISAVGTIISAGYGFICGAYMPISQFSEGLRKVIMFLPGTYGTALVRNHSLEGAFREMSNCGFPDEVVAEMKKSIDCRLFFFDTEVSQFAMYGVMLGSILLLVCIYILLNVFKKKSYTK